MQLGRRSFIGASLAGALLAPRGYLTPAAMAQQPDTKPINVVAAFGFAPDGRTDNYQAFHRWAAHVNRAGGGNYLFPPGVYYVERYRTPERGELDPVRNAGILNCDGLTITGYGARILLNGAFHRSPGRDTNRAIFMPLEFGWCRNLRIAGFEIDGGVRSMTRDPSATEIYSHLIALNGCVAVELLDLDLHHSQTDAVYLYLAGWSPGKRAGTACREVTLKNVRCTNNARGGLAALQVNGLVCVDCTFSENGTGLGRYIAHAPGFGVDVEPDYLSAADVDVRTGNVEFRNCRFDDNVSAFLAAYSQRYDGYLRLIDCSSSNQFDHPYHIIIDWPGALVQGGRHDLGAGTFWTSWQGERGGDLTIRGSEIRTAGLYGLFHAEAGNIVHLDAVRLTGAHRQPGSHGVTLGIQADPGGSRRNSVRNCHVSVPAARKSPGHLYDYEVSLHHTVSEANLFQTDLPVGVGEHFCVEYGRGVVAGGDRFHGTAPGPGDSFRPSHMSNHDTRVPYSTAPT